jgi:HAD superfamily hydrolase (TIGR01509 family)
MSERIPLIFDCDGVIVDSEIVATRVTLRLLRPLGYTATEAEYTRQYSGMLESEIRSHLVKDHGLEVSDDFFAQVLAEVAQAMQVELQPIAGMPELIRRLSLPLSVASNSYVAHVERSLELAGAPWFGDRIFSSEHVPRPKPHPDLYQHAMHRLGYDPGQTWVVEDSVAGVTAAKAAGATVIGFLGASHIHPGHDVRLQGVGADYLAADAAELEIILERKLLNRFA